MSEQMNRIEQFLVSFAEQTRQQFDQVNSHLMLVDRRLDHIETRLNQMDSRFEEIDARFDRIDSRFEQLTLQLDRMEESQNEDIVALLLRLDNKTSDIKELSQYTIKDQALLRFEIEKIKDKLPPLRSFHPEILDTI